jgi:hypothetical protein
MRPSLPLCWEFHLQAFLTLPAGWFGRGRILAKPNDCKNLRPIERSSADHRLRIVQNASYVCGSQRLCLSACGFCWHGRPLAVDPGAQSASPTEPAFVARLVGASVYHGFVVLDDVTSEGFTLGKVTDFEAEPCDEGDAFLIAPDGSRAGIVWDRCIILLRTSNFQYRYIPKHQVRIRIRNSLPSQDERPRSLQKLLPEETGQGSLLPRSQRDRLGRVLLPLRGDILDFEP